MHIRDAVRVLQHLPVHAVDLRILEREQGRQGCIHYMGHRLAQEADPGRRQPPAQHSEREIHRNVADDEEPEIHPAGDLEPSRLFRLEIGRALRCVPCHTEIEDSVEKCHRGGCQHGIAPAFRTAKHERERGQSHRGGGGAEVSPPSVDTLCQADLPGGKPFTHHPNADHESRADKPQ